MKWNDSLIRLSHNKSDEIRFTRFGLHSSLLWCHVLHGVVIDMTIKWSAYKPIIQWYLFSDAYNPVGRWRRSRCLNQHDISGLFQRQGKAFKGLIVPEVSPNIFFTQFEIRKICSLFIFSLVFTLFGDSSHSSDSFALSMCFTQFLLPFVGNSHNTEKVIYFLLLDRKRRRPCFEDETESIIRNRSESG